MPNRYFCSVLDEMRTALKVGHLAHMKGLIEELQTLGNRMEAAIRDMGEIEYIREEHAKAKREKKKEQKELRGLIRQKAEVQAEVDELRDRFRKLTHSMKKVEHGKLDDLGTGMCKRCGEAYMYCACPENPLNSGG